MAKQQLWESTWAAGMWRGGRVETEERKRWGGGGLTSQKWESEGGKGVERRKEIREKIK